MGDLKILLQVFQPHWDFLAVVSKIFGRLKINKKDNKCCIK